MGTSWCRIARAVSGRPTLADEVSPLDELFFSLDGSEVASDEEKWRVEVCGIHFSRAGRWVQLNLCGDTTYNVTLKIDTVDARTIRENLAACVPSAAHPAASLQL